MIYKYNKIGYNRMTIQENIILVIREIPVTSKNITPYEKIIQKRITRKPMAIIMYR
jgi:hypothetical protein